MSEGQRAPLLSRGFITGTLVNFLLYVNYYVLMVVMTSYCLATYDADLSTAGFSASIFIIGALVARFLGGKFIDRVGRRRSLVISAAGEVIFSACYLINGGFFMLFIIRFMHGFFYGVGQTAVTAIVTDLVPDERKGEGIGYYMLSITVGSAIGPFVGMALMQWVGFTLLFIVCTIIALGSLVGALLMKEHKGAALPDVDVASAKVAALDDATAASKIPTVETSTSKTSVSKAPTGETSTRKASAGKGASPLSAFIERSILPISSVAGVTYLAYGSLITYLSAFGKDAGLMFGASLFFVIYSLVMFISRPFTGRIFDRRGDLPIMASGMFAFMIGMLALGWAGSNAMVLLAACFIGYGIGAIEPSGLTLAIKRAPDDRTTAANSTYFVFLDIAIGLSPFLFGWSIPLVGYRGLYLAMIVVIAAAFALYLGFRKHHML